MQSIVKNVLTAAVAGTITAASAAGAPNAAEPKPTVVLVHGAFADGSTWSKVIPLLQDKGVKVVAVQNPLSSLGDDVAATRRVLDMQTGPVVLVGHSWGGMVITQAGTHANVKSLVYVAAFAPSEGQSVTDLSKGHPTPPGFAHILADKEGFLTLSEEGVAKHLAQDVSTEQAKLMFATQNPVRGANFEEKVTAAAWKAKPTWYLASESDNMLQTKLQLEMAEKISARTSSIAASHAPHLSQPKVVADLILAATEAVNQK